MIKLSLIFSSVALITILLSSFNGNAIIFGTSTLKGSTIASESADSSKSVTIGNQEWMSKNLNIDKFRNGDSIPRAKTVKEWEKAGENGEPAWCYYDNDPDNGATYGKLYNWYAVNDPRGLAPVGWHIPSDEEWIVLTDYLGEEGAASTKMKSTSGWKDGSNGTNKSGFSGLPGGLLGIDGYFNYVGSHGYWWSSTESSTVDALFYGLDDYDGIVTRFLSGKVQGLSVRCLRD